MSPKSVHAALYQHAKTCNKVDTPWLYRFGTWPTTQGWYALLHTSMCTTKGLESPNNRLASWQQCHPGSMHLQVICLAYVRPHAFALLLTLTSSIPGAIWAAFADWTRWHKGLLILTSVLALLSRTSTAFVSTFPIICIVALLSEAFSAPVSILSDIAIMSAAKTVSRTPSACPPFVSCFYMLSTHSMQSTQSHAHACICKAMIEAYASTQHQ